jgi:hypothetical protein
VKAWVGERRPAAVAERPARTGTAHTAARQQEVGQDIEHAPTIVPAPTSWKAGFAICGQSFGLWMTSWALDRALVRLHRPRRGGKDGERDVVAHNDVVDAGAISRDTPARSRRPPAG